MCRVAVLLRFDAAVASLSISTNDRDSRDDVPCFGRLLVHEAPRMQMEAMGNGAKILPRLSPLRGSLPEHVCVQVVTDKRRAY
jgi:hypothetical protein